MRAFIVKIDKEQCKGCCLCVDFCPQNVLELSDAFNKTGCHFVEIVVQDRCIGCKRCILVCPDTAIELYQLEGNEKSKKI